jgi:predicted esterase
MPIIFFHGLESGPHGAKYQQLTSLGPIHSPDFRDMDLDARLAHAEAYTREMTDLVGVGSSFGGLVAARLYSTHPERFRGLVLMAPALHYEEATSAIERLPSPEQITVIHGSLDDVVPLEPVQTFLSKFGIDVTVVEDGHRLAESHQLMLDAVERLREDG